MKFSEIFKRDDVTKFASDAERKSPLGTLPSTEPIEDLACSCGTNYVSRLDPDIASDVREPGSIRDVQPRNQGLHKAIVNALQNDIESSEDEAPGRSDRLEAFTTSQVGGPETKITDGSPNARRVGFMKHLLHHVEKAGMTPADVGITNTQYKRFRSAYQGLTGKPISNEEPSAQPVAKPHDSTDCATCEQYRTEFNNRLISYKNKLQKKMLQGDPSVTEEEANKKSGELAKNVFDNWQAGRTSKIKEEKGLHRLLGSWDEHQNEGHDVTFGSMDVSKTPVATTTGLAPGERNPKIEKTFDRLLGLSKGWDLEKDTTYPSDPFLNEEGKPEFTPQSQPGTIEHEDEMDQHINDIVGGEWGQKNIRREQRGDRTHVTVNMPYGQYSGFEPDQPGAVENIIVDRHLTDREQVYNPAKHAPRGRWITEEDLADKPIEISNGALNAGIEGKLPRAHRWLFDQSGVNPDLSALKEHSKAKQEFENQPAYDVVNTGKTRTVEEPQFETKPFFHRNVLEASPLHDQFTDLIKKHGDEVPYEEVSKLHNEANEKSWNEISKEITDPRVLFNFEKHNKNMAPWDDLFREQVIPHPKGLGSIKKNLFHYKKTPKLDSSGNQIVKKTTLPVTKFVPVPAERRLPEPVLDKDLAKSSYDRSFGEALSKMYPGVERGEAEERLRNDHATAVSNKTREIVEQPSNIRSLAKKNIVISTINKARQMLTKTQEIPARLSSVEAAKAKLDSVKSQTPCTKCGKNCTDDVECKSNVMERRRQQAAEAAYND